MGRDSHFRLNKEVISGAICLVPLICPHRLKDFHKTDEAVDTPESGHSTKEGCLNKSGRAWSTVETPKTPAKSPILM